MAFTEFYCNVSTGSNMNGGSDENTSPSYSATNGGWNSGTGVFTPASGNPSLSVAVGQYANVFVDGSTTPVFVGRVTAVSPTTITISTTAKSGTAPTTAGSGVSISVGGVWLGMNAAVGFPMNFVTNTLVNAAGDLPRINYKNNANYSITSNISTVNADTTHQGYSATPGDGGKAVLDGGTTGSSYNLIGFSVGANAALIDFECRNNGATGSAAGVFWNNSGLVHRCVFHNFRGQGLQTNAATRCVECEAYACHASNSGGVGAFHAGGPASFIRCIAHDNVVSNVSGFFITSGGSLDSCISESNGRRGFELTATNTYAKACEAYNNGDDGFILSGGGNAFYVLQNCNAVKNGGYGINCISTHAMGLLSNCGFGSGTQANSSGQTNGVAGMSITDTVTYASNVTPWVDPANGDFRINLAAAKGTGRGAFTQTAPSYAGAVGYPDIGACQHADSGGGGGGRIVGSSIVQPAAF